MAKRIAELLIDTLLKAGVKRIYAVANDSLNELYEAVRKNSKIQWVYVKHEVTGSFAAAADSQLTGKLACCIGKSDSDHIHLINSLQNAHRSGTPLIVMLPAATNLVSGKGGLWTFRPSGLFDNCSYFNEVVSTARLFPEMLQAAVQTAITRQGVSVIGFPGDMVKEKASEEGLFVGNYQKGSCLCPSVKVLQSLANQLNRSKRITLFCGIGCREAHEEVVRLSQLLHAPVVYTFKAKMDVQYDNPNEVGMTGVLGMRSGFSAIQNAETLLMLGTDFPYTAFLPDRAWVAQVDTSPERLGKRTKVDLGLCGDVKTTLNALMPLIRKKSNSFFLKKQLEKYKEVKEDFKTSVLHRGLKNQINPEYVMSLVDKFAENDAIFTIDTGMTCVWGARYLRSSGKRRLLGSFNYGSMTNALPQAIGASLAVPGKQLFALCGNGLSITSEDLKTVVQYRLPMIIVVFNNRSFRMITLETDPDCSTDLDNPDFGEMARMAGMTGMTVKDQDGVLSAIRRALVVKGPVLINLVTDSDEKAMTSAAESARSQRSKVFAETFSKEEQLNGFRNNSL